MDHHPEWDSNLKALQFVISLEGLVGGVYYGETGESHDRPG